MAISFASSIEIMPMLLLTDNEIHILNNLVVVAGIKSSGRLAGAFASGDFGEGLEFGDYRPFSCGDDLRGIDWHHYAGKKLLVLKSFRKYESLQYRICLDTSASVSVADPGKLIRVYQLAIALAWLLLEAGCTVEVFQAGSGTIQSFQGKGGYLRLQEYIQSLEPIANAEIDDLAPESFTRNGCGNIIISDMLSAAGYDKLESVMDLWPDSLTIFSVSSSQERLPSYSGLCTMVDAETGSEVSLEVSPVQIREYVNARERYFDAVAAYACNRNWRYYPVCSDMRLSDAIIAFSPGGVVVL